MTALAIGNTIHGAKGRYRIEKELGRGFYGVTYLAEDVTHNNRPVVVKAPLVDDLGSFGEIKQKHKRALQQFQDEYGSLKRLQGLKCVANVIEALANDVAIQGQAIVTLCIVYEYIDGMALDKYCEVKYCKDAHTGFTGITDSALFFRWAVSLASAIEEVHRRNVAHGDIWPKNVLIREECDPVLIDLGQALLIDLALHGRGQSGWSYPFVAPERRDPERRWYYGADVYSLGGLLYYLATGKGPKEPIEDIDLLKTSVVRAVRESNPELYRANSGVCDVIARCLRSQVDERSRDMLEVLQDIWTLAGPERHQIADPTDVASEIVRLAGVLSRRQSDFFQWIASLRLYAMQKEMQAMTDGLYELRGDHEALVSGLTQFLSILGADDEYITATTLSFWHPDNMGVNGRFLTMNKLVAQRGARVRRVFVISENEERSDTYLRSIIESHALVVRELSEAGIVTRSEECESGRAGYCTGIIKLETHSPERQSVDHIHFGLWRHHGKEVLIVPVYSEQGGKIVAIRFWADPDLSQSQRDGFERIAGQSIAIQDYDIG